MPINTNIMTRVVLGYNQCIFPQEWREKPLLIWYDYFSIPQLEVRNPSVTATDLQNAVDSIPTYVKHLGRKKKRKTLKHPERRGFQGHKKTQVVLDVVANFWQIWIGKFVAQILQNQSITDLYFSGGSVTIHFMYPNAPKKGATNWVFSNLLCQKKSTQHCPWFFLGCSVQTSPLVD